MTPEQAGKIEKEALDFRNKNEYAGIGIQAAYIAGRSKGIEREKALEEAIETYCKHMEKHGKANGNNFYVLFKQLIERNLNTPTEPPQMTDIIEGTKYEVRRYFDGHFEGIAGKYLTHQEAKDIANKLNSWPRAHVNYLVHSIVSPNIKADDGNQITNP